MGGVDPLPCALEHACFLPPFHFHVSDLSTLSESILATPANGQLLDLPSCIPHANPSTNYIPVALPSRQFRILQASESVLFRGLDRKPGKGLAVRMTPSSLTTGPAQRCIYCSHRLRASSSREFATTADRLAAGI